MWLQCSVQWRYICNCSVQWICICNCAVGDGADPAIFDGFLVANTLQSSFVHGGLDDDDGGGHDGHDAAAAAADYSDEVDGGGGGGSDLSISRVEMKQTEQS